MGGSNRGTNDCSQKQLPAADLRADNDMYRNEQNRNCRYLTHPKSAYVHVYHIKKLPREETLYLAAEQRGFITLLPSHNGFQNICRLNLEPIEATTTVELAVVIAAIARRRRLLCAMVLRANKRQHPALEAAVRTDERDVPAGVQGVGDDRGREAAQHDEAGPGAAGVGRAVRGGGRLHQEQVPGGARDVQPRAAAGPRQRRPLGRRHQLRVCECRHRQGRPGGRGRYGARGR